MLKKGQWSSESVGAGGFNVILAVLKSSMHKLSTKGDESALEHSVIRITRRPVETSPLEGRPKLERTPIWGVHLPPLHTVWTVAEDTCPSVHSLVRFPRQTLLACRYLQWIQNFSTDDVVQHARPISHQPVTQTQLFNNNFVTFFIVVQIFSFA